MSTIYSTPAAAMARLAAECERLGMAVPPLDALHPSGIRVSRRGHTDGLPVPTDQPNQRQLCVMLAAMGMKEPAAAWVEHRRTDWYLCTPSNLIGVCLSGVPSNAPDCDVCEAAWCETPEGGCSITPPAMDPAEALAWAICWWTSDRAVADHLGLQSSGASWGCLAAVALRGGITLHLPLRNGVVMEVPDA